MLQCKAKNKEDVLINLLEIINPFLALIFVNSKELFHFSYQRYLINCFRNNFGVEGTPVRLIVREKSDKE